MGRSAGRCRMFQITYYGLHQFFLTERAIYVIVWDATKFEGLLGEELDEVRWAPLFQFSYVSFVG